MTHVEVQQVIDEAQAIVNMCARGLTEQQMRGLLAGRVLAVCGKIREFIATHARPVVENEQWQDPKSVGLCRQLIHNDQRLHAAVGLAMRERPFGRRLAQALHAVIGAMRNVADDSARKQSAGALR